MDKAPKKDSPAATSKKTYVRPRLTVYGSVAELTKGSGSTLTDAPKAGNQF
jgi:hypothetical protein